MARQGPAHEDRMGGDGGNDSAPALDARVALIERRRGRTLTAGQRTAVLRAIDELDDAWLAVGPLAIPVGTEPASVFSPVAAARAPLGESAHG